MHGQKYIKLFKKRSHSEGLGTDGIISKLSMRKYNGAEGGGRDQDKKKWQAFVEAILSLRFQYNSKISILLYISSYKKKKKRKEL